MADLVEVGTASEEDDDREDEDCEDCEDEDEVDGGDVSDGRTWYTYVHNKTILEISRVSIV